MIWATVSSWSCFCWLYRASPSSAANNIINLTLVLTTWWWPCVESSRVIGRCVFYDQCVLLAKLLAFALLHFVFQGQTCLLLQTSYLLTSYYCIPILFDEKDIFLWVLVLEDLVSLHRTIQLQLLQHSWLGHMLVLLWYWIVCLGNKMRCYCHFWDCIQVLHFRLFFDYDGCSISSKSFWPTIVDIMVSWIKFTCFSPFWFTDS